MTSRTNLLSTNRTSLIWRTLTNSLLSMGFLIGIAGCDSAKDLNDSAPTNGTGTASTSDNSPDEKSANVPDGKYQLHVKKETVDENTTQIVIQFGEGAEGKKFTLTGSGVSNSIGNSPVNETKSITVIRKADPEDPRKIEAIVKAEQSGGESFVTDRKIIVRAEDDPETEAVFLVEDGSIHPYREWIPLFSGKGQVPGKVYAEYKVVLVVYDDGDVFIEYEPY